MQSKSQSSGNRDPWSCRRQDKVIDGYWNGHGQICLKTQIRKADPVSLEREDWDLDL